MLIGDHLASGREHQRRHRLVAAHPVLCDVLTANAQRLLGQFLLVDLGGGIPQHVRHDLVGLEERSQHGVGNQGLFRAQQHVDVATARSDVALPVLVPRHLLGDMFFKRR